MAAKLADLGIQAKLISASYRRIRFRVNHADIEVPIGSGIWAAIPGLPHSAAGIQVSYEEAT